MLWIWAVPGALLLGSAWVLTRFLNRRYKRLRFPHRLLQTLRKALRIQGTTTDLQALHTTAPALREELIRLQRILRTSPSLPVDENGIPRLLELAHDLADDNFYTAEAFNQALKTWTPPATPSEVWMLPPAVGVAQSQRLNRVLHAVLADAAQRAKARKLLRRMTRRRRQAALLSKADLASIGLAELADLIQALHNEQLASIFSQWLSENDLSSNALQEYALTRQQRIADELYNAVNCFESLCMLNWLTVCREGDPLHPLLLEDRAEVYPRMSASSQLALRRQVEALARHTHLDVVTVIREALHLAQKADQSSPEASIYYWFQEAEGLLRLHRALPSKKGWLYARFSLRDEWLRYGFLCLWGAVTGFLFLQGRGPVFMLPFFALVTGTLSRWLLGFLPQRELPSITENSTPLRTLAVMPAVLHDPQEALQIVHRLKTTMEAFPAGVNFLLLGDFAPAITPVAAGDQDILHAAASAIDALDDVRVLYFHRARVWDSAWHCYAAHLGRLGALTAVCRLISEGECEDTLVLSTVDTGSLERRYDYVFSLSPDEHPDPDVYSKLLGTMIHPHNSRIPADRGWRGYSILTPEGRTAFDGTGMIRPDAFLEATDGLLPSREDVAVLAGELAGWSAVADARMHSPAAVDKSTEQYVQAKQGWQLLPWQLPLVQTPTGLVSNPLKHASRFRLREALRRSLVPLGQGVLLLYALLIELPLLVVLSLLPFVLTKVPHTRKDAVRLLCRLSLLPTSMLLPFRALYDVLRRQHTPPPGPHFVLWCQGIAAALLTGLGIGLPGLSLPMLAFGVLFACFPLVYKLLNNA